MVLAWRGRPLHGSFLGIPYNFEPPTAGSLRRSVWDPDDSRIFTPKVYGWGYNINLHAVARRLGLI
ncbi:MAG: hypothetical protein IT305_05310 [Chloroflexi bacterium]|nr:hypothetical protein [Chloroflexota bacterium]